MSYEIRVNGQTARVDVAPDTPLLWVLRDELGLKGTKYGCGIAECGACTVLVDGKPTRSCRLQIRRAEGAEIETIESLSPDGTHPLQLAWVAEQVPQCGYCQSGMLMTSAALLRANPSPSDADIDTAVTNICRCGTYPRVRAAIHRAVGEMTPTPTESDDQGTTGS